MPPYSHYLPFTNVNQITFEPTVNDVLIKVNNTELGRIQNIYPVSVYVEVTSQGNRIWIKEITDAQYMQNNNYDPEKTVLYNHAHLGAGLQVVKCPANNTFQIVGWDTEDNGIICTNGNGYFGHFAISQYLFFKAKMELTVINNVRRVRMCMRYENEIKEECPADPLCCTELFCYVCGLA